MMNLCVARLAPKLATTTTTGLDNNKNNDDDDDERTSEGKVDVDNIKKALRWKRQFLSVPNSELRPAPTIATTATMF